MIAGRTGELYAALSVLAFAFGGVAVARARRAGPGDGGAVLSVVLTAALAAGVWLASGARAAPGDRVGATGLAWFALSGLLATVAGRGLYFRSVQSLGAIRASAVKRAIPFFSILLGVALLGETLTGVGLGGVGLIVASVAALAWLDRSASGRTGATASFDPLGYAWGTLSGLCYATSYVARKLGLAQVPDGALGALVGALAAVVFYVVSGLASRHRRAALLASLTARNRWAVAAAFGFSIGQIANFYAVQYVPVSTVGAIQSLEVFVAMLLAAYVLRTEPPPTLPTVAAAALGTAGVLLVVR